MAAMVIRDIMTAPVIRVQPNARVRQALQVMMEAQVDGLPVVDDRNQVVGILTYADLLRHGRRHHPRALDFMLYAVVIQEQAQDVYDRVRRLLDQPVGQLCTKAVITCCPDDCVTEVAGLMVDHDVQRVPVVSQHGSLVGIVSRGDIMHAIWQMCHDPNEES